MYASIWVVVGCDFLVEVELCLGGRIIGFLEYCYRRIVAKTPLSELLRLISFESHIYTMRFQWQESRVCGGSARDLLLAQETMLDHANILNAMPASVHQCSLGSEIPKGPKDHLLEKGSPSTYGETKETQRGIGPHPNKKYSVQQPICFKFQ